MTQALLYYNPRCSTCRTTLALLEEGGISVEVKEYLKEGVTRDEVISLSKKLKMHPSEFIREKDLESANIEGTDYSVEEWCEMIEENPNILQRPIIVLDSKACVCRPPETVLAFLDQL